GFNSVTKAAKERSFSNLPNGRQVFKSSHFQIEVKKWNGFKMCIGYTYFFSLASFLFPLFHRKGAKVARRTQGFKFVKNRGLWPA
ncbi:hypothetical protein, partial [Flavobacterium sp.]|uniref:hypothetical protein n=1 Tax=Flavobacterium sp. TaxID=239 RepID=UPI00391994A5